MEGEDRSLGPATLYSLQYTRVTRTCSNNKQTADNEKGSLFTQVDFLRKKSTCVKTDSDEKKGGEEGSKCRMHINICCVFLWLSFPRVLTRK